MVVTRATDGGAAVLHEDEEEDGAASLSLSPAHHGAVNGVVERDDRESWSGSQVLSLGLLIHPTLRAVFSF